MTTVLIVDVVFADCVAFQFVELSGRHIGVHSVKFRAFAARRRLAYRTSRGVDDFATRGLPLFKAHELRVLRSICHKSPPTASANRACRYRSHQTGRYSAAED